MLHALKCGYSKDGLVVAKTTHILMNWINNCDHSLYGRCQMWYGCDTVTVQYFPIIFCVLRKRYEKKNSMEYYKFAMRHYEFWRENCKNEIISAFEP